MRLNLRTLLGLSFALLLSTSAPALADSFLGVNWPAFGLDQHPSVVFTINPDLSVTTTTDGTQGPYDGIEDSYIGVINNSAQAVNSFVVSAGTTIYGFDGDGIDTFGSAGNGSDNTGYGGPQGFFTGINAGLTSGTVNFVGGIAAGAHTWFSLEEPPASLGNIGGGGVVGGAVPEPTPLLLAGMGILGLLGYKLGRRKQLA
jgi:hypothetical protein